MCFYKKLRPAHDQFDTNVFDISNWNVILDNLCKLGNYIEKYYEIINKMYINIF